MCANLRLAWKHVRHDRILIIEDDDYYAPNYVATMLSWLEEADLVGEVGARYYFVQRRLYRLFTEHEHASLCRSGFRRSVLPLVRKLTAGDDWRVDMQMWATWTGSRRLSPAPARGRALSVSMKGMPGRTGVTHGPSRSWAVSDDRNLEQLRDWLGPDHEVYLPYLGDQSPEVPDLQVYTVSVGGYDRLQRQPRRPGVAYAAVTDGPVIEPWSKVPFEATNGSPRRASRRPKIMAHEVFPEATTLYIDANIRLTDPRGLAQAMIQARPDAQLYLIQHNMRSYVGQEAVAVVQMGLADADIVSTYMARYEPLGPAERRLAWGGVILRRPGCELFNQIWWEEYCSGPMRDQISLPYAIHKSGVAYCLVGLPYPLVPGQRTLWLSFQRHQKPRMQMEH
jgi:hypothetical protein